jgi:arabinofuranosyltransferase
MKKIYTYSKQNWVFLSLSILFIVWALTFIYHSSYVAIDGRLYFNLFDDAMISMRYAWNFSHGNGLVWNVGDRVEGYTNLLMTIMMSIATLFFEKRYAVLFIQLTGIFFTLGTAFFTLKIFEILKPSAKVFERHLLFIVVLLYYPLNFWSLMGMETGMLAFLLSAGVLYSMLYVEKLDKKYLWLMSGCFGLAFLTRNDSLLFAVLAFLYVSQRLKDGRTYVYSFLAAGLVYGLFVIGQTVFRYAYYGEIVPNTYTLKLVGMPLMERLRNGWGFIKPFFKETGFALLMALFGLLLNPSRQRLYLFGFFLISVFYQIYVGGDPWNYWRMMAPAMPFLFILFFEGCAEVLHRIPKTSNGLAFTILFFALTLGGEFLMDFRFLREISLFSYPYDNGPARKNVDISIAINALTDENATIGVFWAGTIPYYADRIAIDFLGKSDPYIANLSPDLSGAMGWLGMNSVPGHNKYDLNYSIKELLPTYVQEFEVGSQDLNTWGAEHYANVKYHGVRLYLLKNSSNVLWNKIKR